MTDIKKALVTGAGGFIGSHLVEALLERGAAVKALVRYNSRNHWGWLEASRGRLGRGLEVVAGDVRDPHQMLDAVAGCDAVFHLAALIGIPYSVHAPASYIETNVAGTQNVATAAVRHGVKAFIHTSTSETYGTAQYEPMDEKHPLQPHSPYAASKVAADKLVESFRHTYDLPAVTVRPFNTYGPRQSARAVIPTIITQALSGKTVRLGSLDPVRDLRAVETEFILSDLAIIENRKEKLEKQIKAKKSDKDADYNVYLQAARPASKPTSDAAEVDAL